MPRRGNTVGKELSVSERQNICACMSMHTEKERRGGNGSQICALNLSTLPPFSPCSSSYAELHGIGGHRALTSSLVCAHFKQSPQAFFFVSEFTLHESEECQLK